MVVIKVGVKSQCLEGVGSSAALEDLRAVVGWVNTDGYGHQSGGDQKSPARRMKRIVCPGGQHQRRSKYYR